MINSDNINEKISAAADLDALLDALTSYEDGSKRLDEVADLPGLPTFGGDEPEDTAGIWSWDADRLLVDDCNGGFAIESRESYYA